MVIELALAVFFLSRGCQLEIVAPLSKLFLSVDLEISPKTEFDGVSTERASCPFSFAKCILCKILLVRVQVLLVIIQVVSRVATPQRSINILLIIHDQLFAKPW